MEPGVKQEKKEPVRKGPVKKEPVKKPPVKKGPVKKPPVKKGPMDKFLKSLDDSDDSPGCSKPVEQQPPKVSAAQSRPPVQPDNQEEKKHETHSFQWTGNDKTLNFTCDKPGTIQDSLERSEKFRKMAEKNKMKELVFLRNGKAIAPHFPCSLIKDEVVKVRYIKASSQVNSSSAAAVVKRKGKTEKLLVFHLSTKGGENTKNIMNNREFPKQFDEITVYAYEGEKVKDALKRDGRFLSTVFKKNCALLETGPEIITEMLDLVDRLDGKTVKIIKLDNKPPPDSPPGSQGDLQGMESETDLNVNQDPPQQSTTAETVNDDAQNENPEQISVFQPKEIPNSQKMKQHLSSLVTNLVKGKKTVALRCSRAQNVFQVEFGKNAQTCREVKKMKKLMDLSSSVCQVRINGSPTGTGFLLFDKFVLTNGHVIKDIYDQSTGQLRQQMTVHFSFESLDQGGSGVTVEGIEGFEYGPDASGQNDWALLSVSADQNLPDPLLKHFGFLPMSGAICIIGHPDGGVKRVDPCLIIPTQEHNKVVKKHSQENPEGVWVEHNGTVQLATSFFFEGTQQHLQSLGSVLAYESCFYGGSSGSPVFNEHCNVVAMHSGGYVYHKMSGERNSVIEFGFPLSSILEHMIIQMLRSKRQNVLKSYLDTEYSQKTHIHDNVKKLVESRCPGVLNESLLDTDDKSLKMFFEFLLEPVLMDTD